MRLNIRSQHIRVRGDRTTQGTSTLEREDQRDSQGVHVADGPSGHDSVGHGFLELPER